MLPTRPNPIAWFLLLVLAQNALVAAALLMASSLALWPVVAVMLLSLALGGLMLRHLTAATVPQTAVEPDATLPAAPAADQPLDDHRETLHAQEIAKTKERLEEAHLEAGTLRDVLSSLDGGMRRLACGDFGVRLLDEFPDEFEGLRMDFNRALSRLQENLQSVTSRASTLHDSGAELQTQARLLREGCISQTADVARVAADAHSLIDSLGRRDREIGDLANIAYSAMLDLGRSEQAVAAPLEAIRTVSATTGAMAPIADHMLQLALQANMAAMHLKAGAADEATDAQPLGALAEDIRRLVEEGAQAATDMAVLGRQAAQAAAEGDKASGRITGEMAATRVYVEALHQKAQKLAEPTAPQRKQAAELRSAVMVLARTSRENITQIDVFSRKASDLLREVATLDRETVRFMPVTTIQPNSVFKPQPHELRKHPSHLRLVKT
jgi:methyl-accepting chemotaxis protein